MERVRWGVLGDAEIGREKVIPAMQKGACTEVVALASRDLDKAKRSAAVSGIPKAHGSYEALLEDPVVEAVYIPLPNHLHVPWSIKAAEAGKHVLCEKPIALDVAEAKTLVAARDRAGVLVQEAFMVRTAPQWLRARELVQSGAIGELRAAQWSFSYMNMDADNVRNIADIGGGAAYDIGCYPINTCRFVFGTEPRRVVALIDRDPTFRTDRLDTVILDFHNGQASFLCSTQLVPYQRAQFFGTTGRIEVETPGNAPPDKANRLFVDDGSVLGGGSAKVEELPVADQYTIQGDVFSQAIRGVGPQAYTLEDSLGNMAVIDAVFRSAESGRWEDVAG